MKGIYGIKPVSGNIFPFIITGKPQSYGAENARIASSHAKPHIRVKAVVHGIEVADVAVVAGLQLNGGRESGAGGIIEGYVLKELVILKGIADLCLQSGYDK